MLEVHRHPLVPIGGGDIIERMAIIARRVVDQHVAATELGDQLFDLEPVIGAIGDVAAQEVRRDFGIREPPDELFARAFLNVDKGDGRALSDEGFHHRLTNAGAATADDHLAPGKARVDRAVHASAARMRVQNLSPSLSDAADDP